MSIFYLGSARYRQVMTDAAALLVPAVTNLGGNANQLYPQSETYRRIVTAEGTLPNFAVGSQEWHQRLTDLASGPPPVAIPLSVVMTAPVDASTPPTGVDLVLTADVTAGDTSAGPYSTEFFYGGVSQGTAVGLTPTVTVLGVDVVAGATAIECTTADSTPIIPETATSPSINVNPALAALAATVTVNGQEATVDWGTTGDPTKTVLIDWGDGSGEVNYQQATGFAKHTYALAGSYGGTYRQDPSMPTDFSATALFSGAMADGETSPEFLAYGLPVWIRKDKPCRVGFDVRDGDPDPDVWVLWVKVLTMDIEPRQKEAINQQLKAVGCA